MKIRTDYVTNSSSSSFVFAFADEEDYTQFAEYCDWFDYNEVKKIFSRLRIGDSTEKMKKEARDILKTSYIADKRRELLREKFGKILDIRARTRAESEYMKSEEYEETIKEYLNGTDYNKKLQKIENAKIVIVGEMWDTDGGIFEWAVRNGFLEDRFPEWCLIVWNVG